MRKRQSTKQKKEKHKEGLTQKEERTFTAVKEPTPLIVSKYPEIRKKTEEIKQMSTFKKDDSSSSKSGSSAATAKTSSSKEEESPGAKQRRLQDEAEAKGEVHSAITIDDEGNPVQEHTAGA